MAPRKVSETIALGVTILGVVVLGAVRFTPVSWAPWDVAFAFGLFGAGLAALVVLKRMRQAKPSGADNAV